MIEKEELTLKAKEFFPGGTYSTEYQFLDNIWPKIGLSEDDDVLYVTGCRSDKGVDPETRQIPSKGWSRFDDIDDFSIAIYKDGMPKLGVYISTRGSLYQAGAYLPDTGEMLYAHNLPGVSGRSEVVDQWEQSDKECIDCQIAFEWLMGFDPLNQQEHEAQRKSICRHMDKMFGKPPGTWERISNEIYLKMKKEN